MHGLLCQDRPTMFLAPSVIASEAKQSRIKKQVWIASSPSAPRNDEVRRAALAGRIQIYISNSIRHDLAFPRRITPESCDRHGPRRARGRRECRALAAPMARLQQESRRQSPQVSRTSGIPCAMVLTLIRALPGDRLVCPRIASTREAHCAGHQHRDARTTRFHVRDAPFVRTQERSMLRHLTSTASPPHVS